MNADAVQLSRDAEHAAGIASDSRPSAELLATVSGAAIVLSSDLARARETAQLLAPHREIPASPLLRETVLEVPTWLPFHWPNAMWEGAIHLQWGFRILLGQDPPEDERRRATAAAAWLAELCEDEMTVVVVTHGVFRRHLARELIAGGWVEENRRRSYHPLSAWSFNK